MVSELLALVLGEKRIASRRALLRQVKDQRRGQELTPAEVDTFMDVFERFYTPDEHRKFTRDEVARVSVEPNGWGDHHFMVWVAGVGYAVGMTPLSGTRRSPIKRLNSAMRAAVETQISDFRNKNPLDPRAACPLAPDTVLGEDAQVDHVIHFSALRDDWIRIITQERGTPPKATLDTENHVNVICDGLEASWLAHHAEHAQLRWLSRASNQRRPNAPKTQAPPG